jgi:hypothetical protein
VYASWLLNLPTALGWLRVAPIGTNAQERVERVVFASGGPGGRPTFVLTRSPELPSGVWRASSEISAGQRCTSSCPSHVSTALPLAHSSAPRGQSAGPHQDGPICSGVVQRPKQIPQDRLADGCGSISFALDDDGLAVPVRE